MQWIFMLVGLVIGAAAGESITGAVLGAVVGLALGQTFALHSLQRENASLRSELKTFGERFDQGTKALYERLLQVERGPVGQTPPPVSVETVAPEMPVAPTEPEVEVDVPVSEPAATELEWNIELPTDELAPAPAAAARVEAPIEWSDLVLEPMERPAAQARVEEPEAQPQPAPAAPPLPPAPPVPSLFDRAFGAARDWLLGGNTVLRVGVVLLFLGLAFLLRYATEGMTMPPQGPYLGTAAAALALLGLGWWLRQRRPAYALILQGTGVAVLYLTVFASIKLYPAMNHGEVLIDPKAGFVLLVAVTLFSAILAILQDAVGLAAAAALGGFAAPILASTGGGSHVALFSYFALLNAGIFAIAWFKAWRMLNLIGFFGTFGIGLAWGLRSYQPELFATTEPFLILFFLTYVAIGLLFARRRLREAAGAPDDNSREALLRWSARQTDYVDGTVLFGTPLVGFGLQYGIIQHLEFGAAFSALALGLFYMVLARLLAGRTAGRALLLVETCLALGVVFGTLAIPLGLDARWTSAAWAVEGAGIFWLGLRQQRPLARIFALLLQVGAALAFLAGLEVNPLSLTLLDGAPLGALMLGVALLFSFWSLRIAAPQTLRSWEPNARPVLAAFGLTFLYLIAPLLMGADGTAMSWAVAGLATLFAALRLRSRTFLACTFAVQLLGGAVFLLHLHGAQEGGGVLGSGWRGLVTASLIGLALIAAMLIAARDSMVRDDRRLMLGLSVVLLLGLAFINLAVLFVLRWQTAAAVWAGSGLLILWLSLQLQQRAAFVFGLVLQVIGAGAFLFGGAALFGDLPSEGLKPLAHMGFWTPAVLALAALVGAWRLHRASERERNLALGGLGLEQLSQLLLVWGAGWWALTAVWEIARFVPGEMREHVALLVAAVSVGLWSLLARREQWRALALLCLALVPVSLVALASAWSLGYHPLAELGWLGWLAVFAVHFFTLRRLDALLPHRAAQVAHVLGCWLILGVLALELRYLFFALAEHYNAWRWLGWALVPSLFLILMGGMARLPWPVAAFEREYRAIAAVPVALALLGWFWLVNLFSNGAADPLPYLPLVNPLELGMLIVLAAIFQWTRLGLPQLGVAESTLRLPVQAVLGASLFALLTMAVCRTAHHWGGVPFEFDSLSQSMLVQAGLSIVWALIALGLMIAGHLRGRRDFWLVGAVLLVVVVIKLFLVDRASGGSLERIISFIGVGVLMLIVGYFAPLPPRRPQPDEQPQQELPSA
ncbi:DUF2339 domain-containing protein [Pseudomonas nicosulfuronedens]|uniref:DUF2339 domain-containing protein n=1 Tax=Pseudomonas nicosulfuronedens TaxID=2571105 RepID=UPI00244D1FAD|nr:DUF2339 domain-containing protein [Pseudomonas nicosulfuronedens]MDH1008720.1 DUF2339 domain-containing protein [Pseudomonas nicosulfuronedens]MDH1983008.1 DUF2339 domain-containing protein [Pseudomonas nicosulfuronedens]MDH2028619.1 DUF2339 domain-containing protein [Pseudomonas nicosulfuronedens]